MVRFQQGPSSKLQAANFSLYLHMVDGAKEISELEAVNITGTDTPAISGNTAEERNREKASSEDIYSTL